MPADAQGGGWGEEEGGEEGGEGFRGRGHVAADSRLLHVKNVVFTFLMHTTYSVGVPCSSMV